MASGNMRGQYFNQRPKGMAQRIANEIRRERTNERGLVGAKRLVFRFVACLTVGMIGFNVVLVVWFSGTDAFQSLLGLNAQISAAVLRALGEDAVSSGASVLSTRYSLNIARGCDASQVAAFLALAIVVWPLPIPWKRRIMGLAVGVPILLVLNIVRVVSLYFVGADWPKAFDSMHNDIWQPAFVVAALLLWVGWVSWCSRAGAQESDATA